MPSLRLLLLIPLVTAACNETSSGVHYDYVSRHRESFAFQVPREKIVEGIRNLMAERGGELVEPTTGDVIHTTNDFTITLVPAKAGTFVHIVASVRGRDGKITSAIDYDDLEWELAKRVEPDRTFALMEAANKRADSVAPRALKHKDP